LLHPVNRRCSTHALHATLLAVSPAQAALLEHDMSDARAKGHQLGVNPAADDQEAFSDDTLGEGDGGDDPGVSSTLTTAGGRVGGRAGVVVYTRGR
jgi:hypothetical protein